MNTTHPKVFSLFGVLKFALLEQLWVPSSDESVTDQQWFLFSCLVGEILIPTITFAVLPLDGAWNTGFVCAESVLESAMQEVRLEELVTHNGIGGNSSPGTNLF